MFLYRGHWWNSNVCPNIPGDRWFGTLILMESFSFKTFARLTVSSQSSLHSQDYNLKAGEWAFSHQKWWCSYKRKAKLWRTLSMRPVTADQRMHGHKRKMQMVRSSLVLFCKEDSLLHFFEGLVWVWFVLQMKKDGTESVTDLPKATQRVNGKAEERTHCSSVWV